MRYSSKISQTKSNFTQLYYITTIISRRRISTTYWQNTSNQKFKTQAMKWFYLTAASWDRHHIQTYMYVYVCIWQISEPWCVIKITLEEVDINSHAETKFYNIYKSKDMKRNHPQTTQARSPNINLHSVISQKTEIVNSIWLWIIYFINTYNTFI